VEALIGKDINKLLDMNIPLMANGKNNGILYLLLKEGVTEDAFAKYHILNSRKFKLEKATLDDVRN